MQWPLTTVFVISKRKTTRSLKTSTSLKPELRNQQTNCMNWKLLKKTPAQGRLKYTTLDMDLRMMSGETNKTLWTFSPLREVGIHSTSTLLGVTLLQFQSVFYTEHFRPFHLHNELCYQIKAALNSKSRCED